MPRPRRWWSPTAFAAAVITAALAVAMAAVAGEALLAPGVELPSIEARILDGNKAALPKDGIGHAFLIVVGFSKAAAQDTRPWLEACRNAPGVVCYDVRMVEDVPRVFRRMMERGMKSGLPADLQQRTLLVYEHNETWRNRLDVTDISTAYVVACDDRGMVRGVARGPYTDAELKRLLGAIVSTPTSMPVGPQNNLP